MTLTLTPRLYDSKWTKFFQLSKYSNCMKDSNYDILAISESWLNSTVTNAEVEIEGFKLTRLDRLGKTGGGVCVYSKSSIKVKCLKNITRISEFGFHQLWMLIQLRKLRSILLCVTNLNLS